MTFNESLAVVAALIHLPTEQASKLPPALGS